MKSLPRVRFPEWPGVTPPVLTAQAMRSADRYTIETYGIPGFTLMESAGRAAARRIEAHYGPVAGKRVACFCGKGNNGGDGFVVARVLVHHGARVRVFALGDREAMSEDAARNAALLDALGAHVPEERLDVVRYESLSQVAASPPADLYVDALLGTGLTSALRAPLDGIVDWLKDRRAPTVALDVPTGLNSDDGRVLGTAVRADLTVTMAALKAGLLIGAGPDHAGTIDVVEIGIPAFVLDRASRDPGCARYPTDALVRRWLPERPRDAHKYSVGLALVVGGSPGLTGAPVMSSLAAARSGAGFVTCACQEDIQPLLAGKLTEVTTLALPRAEDGGVAPGAALDALSPPLEKAGALLVGPGLGRAASTRRFVHELLRRTERPVVLDADGLNAVAGEGTFIADHAERRWILTPHTGEFYRLAGEEVDLTDRVRVVQRYARQWNAVVLLKGMPSIVAGPDGTAYVGSTGNPGTASAGTGDVLAGLCVGFLAQGLAPLQAAVAALHVAGAAAERFAERFHPHTLMALDLVDQLPHLLRERFH